MRQKSNGVNTTIATLMDLQNDVVFVGKYRLRYFGFSVFLSKLRILKHDSIKLFHLAHF